MAPTIRSTGATGNGSAFFAPVQNPILRSVDPLKVSKFFREWERYGEEVMEKRKEVPSMSLASFKVSVDRGLLKTLHGLGRLKSVAPDVAFDDLTSDKIKIFLKTLINKGDDESVNPSVIKDALKGLQMPTHISDPEARALEFVHDLFQRLESVGYGSFKDRNPEKTIKLIQCHLYPQELKSAMREHLDYQHGLKMDVNQYVDTLCKEAAICERIHRKTHRGGKNEVKKDHEQVRKPSDGTPGPTSIVSKTQTLRKLGKKLLLCLNHTCKRKGTKHEGRVRNFL